MDFLEGVTNVVLGKLTEKAIDKFSPYLLPKFNNGPTAWEQWLELKGQPRLEALLSADEQLKQEFQDLQEIISSEEKLSPSSGYTQTLKEYITTPLEEKLEMLRNALLSGIYGDYTLDQREQLYKWVSNLQPIDMRVLDYLYQLCPSVQHYEEIVRTESLLNPEMERVWLGSSFGKIARQGFGDPPSEEDGGLHEFCRLNGLEEASVYQSLDRLRAQGLIYKSVPTMDVLNPYKGCLPTKSAKILLDFVADPRNGTPQQARA